MGGESRSECCRSGLRNTRLVQSGGVSEAEDSEIEDSAEDADDKGFRTGLRMDIDAKGSVVCNRPTTAHLAGMGRYRASPRALSSPRRHTLVVGIRVGLPKVAFRVSEK